MIKTLIFFAVLLAIAFGGAWLADRPGQIIINWPFMDSGIEISLLVGFLLLVAAMALAVILWVVVRSLWKSPGAISGFFSGRRRDKGYKALSTGMIAVGVGDLARAKKYAGKARKLLGDEPMTLMLEAQTAQLAGDATKARQSFEAMLDLDETRALGRRGLYIEAQRRGDADEAMEMAKAATGDGKKAPGWAGTALFDMQTASGDWKGALITLSQNHANKHISKEQFRRHRAVILTAQAMELDADTQSSDIKALLQEACKLAPGLVPAVTMTADLFNESGDYRKASKLIEGAWRIEPHPELAKTYAFIKTGDTAVDRLKRIRSLYALMPDHKEARIALARACLDAREWVEARGLLEPLAASHLTPRICMLMAELEEGEKSDFGLVRQWLARAVGAHRDPVWVADGQVSESWQPTSPVTGKLDVFEWKVPVRELSQESQPMIEPGDAAEDEPAEDRMVLISADKPEEAEPAASADDEAEDITDITPDDEAEKAVEPEAKADAVAEDKVVEDLPPAAVVSDEDVAAKADSEAVAEEIEAASSEDEAKDEEIRDTGLKADKPQEVQFALSHPPDDPGPRKDTNGKALPPTPEKRFRLF
ncbi:heme biosynthesis HemY N-terminal domain-containing protein [uncultured Cohaesibacter sp.]|uniref:heme biosynthesis HemY N-terminal domain-containing protein n=1 Tax=uncultured Cohaesibacter sp. TaxID=1002546 RepID=UPI0029C87F16|nr:heme biosynthesis HemY N-terminal domain-containing protein [uncultured Cohaesibacter sp.]